MWLTEESQRTLQYHQQTSASSFAGCASPCKRYSCVERAGPTLCIHRRSLCASRFLCMHKNVRGARRMNVHARRTPAIRRMRWTNARHTRDKRWACVVSSSTEVYRTKFLKYAWSSLRSSTSSWSYRPNYRRLPIHGRTQNLR